MPELPTLPIKLRPSIWKMLFLLIGSVVLAAGGFLVARKDPLVGCACVAFFGLCALVGAVSLHPRSSYLELTEAGVTFVSLFRRSFVPWGAVREFVPIKIRHNQMVGWNYLSEFSGSSKVGRVSTALTGVEATLPDTYSLSAADLAILLNGLLATYRR